ncbi:hypothetical protein SDC9_180572 [bioreactor metagenome]|uniref:Uncharacterized protein n=1 Tax=bioreactor metagenome TaxID=1076179 RepID=A0A645H4W8_9ZZZZ
MHTARAGLGSGDFVDDVHSFDHFAEDAVAVVLGRRRLEVEEIIVDEVDEELRRRRINHIGAGHGERSALVGTLVGRFVLDRFAGRFLDEVFGEPAALHHESRNYAMENGSLVETGIDVVEEIFRGDGGVFFEKPDFDVAFAGLQRDHEYQVSLGFFIQYRDSDEIQMRGGAPCRD